WAAARAVRRPVGPPAGAAGCAVPSPDRRVWYSWLGPTLPVLGALPAAAVTAGQQRVGIQPEQSVGGRNPASFSRCGLADSFCPQAREATPLDVTAVRECLVNAASRQASRGGPDPDSRPVRAVAWSRCAEALARRGSRHPLRGTPGGRGAGPGGAPLPTRSHPQRSPHT